MGQFFTSHFLDLKFGRICNSVPNTVFNKLCFDFNNNAWANMKFMRNSISRTEIRNTSSHLFHVYCIFTEANVKSGICIYEQLRIFRNPFDNWLRIWDFKLIKFSDVSSPKRSWQNQCFEISAEAGMSSIWIWRINYLK